jgi:hypothetical protein
MTGSPTRHATRRIGGAGRPSVSEVTQLRRPLRNIDVRHIMPNEPIMKTSRLLTAVAVLRMTPVGLAESLVGQFSGTVDSSLRGTDIARI